MAGITMRCNVLLAIMAGWVVLLGPAEAQSLNGCWHYSDGSVFSTVCISDATEGTFNLDYAVEDDQQGLVKGSCNGAIQIQPSGDGDIAFTVPFQEEACRQEDQVFRLARRDYSCAFDQGKLICDLTVFYDDGSVFGEAVGLEYSR
ncbi:MAG: hypothetical protein AAGC57_03565 [Pseudomonadota bacterium]